ncbi:WD repeat-containing 32 [Micractinium conductrix]|uniref:WD repeat-containing 32 n=1 Tax=Micractinium conductrix TaxID=554055 RepID=A0A2P6V8B7_9CHLO|nr:WD repeat-containing 32 [Micractinium conductrix]|eukprot:PSC70328.1 WD repeat-containing 32 [Micractinium conductrix]
MLRRRSVRRYVCEVLAADGAAAAAGSTAGEGAADGGGGPDGRVTGFRQLPGCLSDPALARAYSITWRPGLVAAGGKDGVVSVWGSREAEAGTLAANAAVPPLLSGKLHKGWIAEVQFLSAACGNASGSGGDGCGGGGGLLRLLTAGNDGTVGLWDLGRAAEAGGRGGLVPQCLARATDLHSGGIFSLHERGGRLLTAAKDASVAISSLGEGSRAGGAALTVLHRYEDLHSGVVKCARWRDDHCFASCGNDRRLVVVDSRQPTSTGPCFAIEGAHGSAINCLRWHPSEQHLLLSSSHDPAALVQDLRSPGQPLHRLLGHAQGARVGSIYQPAWVAGGAAVATGCERSTLLSLYCTRTGAAISRGDAGFSLGAALCRGAAPGDPLLVSAPRSVLLFAPTWGAEAPA